MTNEKENKLQVALNKIAELEQRLQNTRAVTKEFSDYFLNKKSEQQAYKNLSETKRHLESKHEDILKAMLQDKKVTNDEFNTKLVEILRKALF